MRDLPDRQTDWDFARRVIIAIALVGMAYFLWMISRVLLLFFAAALIAILVHEFAVLLSRLASLKERWALLVAVLILAALGGGFAVLFGSQVAVQLGEVLNRLPAALDEITASFEIPDASTLLTGTFDAGTAGNVLSRIAGVGYTILGALGEVLLVVVVSIYLAADPGLYKRGTVQLFPPAQHERMLGALNATALALRLWFLGQLVSMAAVGLISGLAFWLIGLPSPLALGLIAGITNFIPFLGPLIGSVPALIFAASLSTETLLWTIAAILVIQQLEGNVILPLAQRHAVSLPPALALMAMLVFGLLFGLLGLFLAVPLTVALMTLVRKLWIRETLGETTHLPGEGSR